MKSLICLLFLFIYFRQPLAKEQCKPDFMKTSILGDNKEMINVLLIWFPINVGAETTLRICSRETGLPVKRHCGYDRVNDTGLWDNLGDEIKLVNCSSIQNLCIEEPFEHKYIMENGTIEAFHNRWKPANISQRGDLQEPCLTTTGVPLTRLCEYNPVTNAAQWELLRPDMANFSCYRNQQLITYDLNALYRQTKKSSAEGKVEAKQVATNLTELLATSQDVRVAADIRISTEILKIITEDDKRPQLISDVLNVIDIIMAENETTIIESEQVNASSSFLKTIDTYLHKMAEVVVPTNYCNNVTDGIFHEIVPRASVFYINPFCSNITGLAIYEEKTHERQLYDENTGYFYSFLYMNRTLDYITNAPGLVLASYFPLSLWNKMKNYLGSVNNETTLTFTLFQNHKLFVSHTKLREKPNNYILEIKISKYRGQLPEVLPYMYGFPKNILENNKQPRCVYWEPNINSWLTNDISTQLRNIGNSQLVMCRSKHLTHLGAILNISFPDKHDIMLNYISIFGCGLSLLGLSGIWLTAVCFKSFRGNPSNKLLLNMSFVLTLLMVYFLLSNLPKDYNPFNYENNSFGCKLTGALLHYSVTVLFLWMLIVAVMQYLRYVKVIGYSMPSRFILKFGALAWGLPLIPVTFIAYKDGYTFTKSNITNSICYPNEDNLKYGVALPMGIIVMVNIVVFCCVLYSLRRSLVQFEHHARKHIKYQVRISVLMFFLLGISWLFGILSYLSKSPVSLYIFNLTSTLQGFMLFIFSIIFDEPTRLGWVVFCCAKSYNTREGTRQPRYVNMNSLANM